MKIITETPLDRFEAWSGAEDTLETLKEKDLCDRLEQILEYDIFPNGCTDDELNDFLWFECDTIAKMLGFSSWEELEGNEEEIVEEDEDENNFSKWCVSNGHLWCKGCPYERCNSIFECEDMFYKDNPDMEDGIRLNVC